MPWQITVNDNLNDTDGTLLTAHVPGTGTGWTMMDGPNNNAAIKNDTTISGLISNWHNTTAKTFYSAECVETETDAQRVTVVIGPVGNPRRFIMPSVRLSAGATSVDGYGIEIDDTGNSIELHRFDDGVDVLLDTANSEPVGATSTIIYEVSATGDHSVRLDGNLVNWETASSTVVNDNTHTGGKFGLTLERSLTDIAIDSFVGEYDVTAGDTTPDAFSFTDQTDVALSTQIESNTITVAGIDTVSPISISGDASAEYRINGGAYTSTAGNVNNGDTVQLRVTSSGSLNTMVSATLDIGGVTDQWDVTTVAVIQSTINLSVSGAADQAYTVNFCDATTGAQIEQKSVTFASEAGSTTLNVAAGTAIIGYLVDAAPGATEGATVTGTTV